MLHLICRSCGIEFDCNADIICSNMKVIDNRKCRCLECKLLGKDDDNPRVYPINNCHDCFDGILDVESINIAMSL